MFRLSPTLVALSLLAAASNIHARIINLPDDAGTLRAAVEAADAGDTILVAPGEYRGDGNVNVGIAEALTLLSTDGPLETIFDGEGADALRGLTVQDVPIHIVGLTFTRFTDGAVQLSGSEGFSISDCIFTRNQRSAGGTQGAALLLLATSRGTVGSSLFEENVAAGSGAAIYATVNSAVGAADCQFLGNRAVRFGGAVITNSDAAGRFQRCLFQGNSAGIDGGAVTSSVRGISTFDFCTFVENRATGLGGAIYAGSNANPQISDCIFQGNSAEQGGNHVFGQEDRSGLITIAFSNVEGGLDDAGNVEAGEGIIDVEPQFVEGRPPLWGSGDYYLDPESGCIDAGSGGADGLGVANFTTRTDLAGDDGTADLGFHYDPAAIPIYGHLVGRVTDLLTGDPVAGVRIISTLRQSAVTDDDGRFVIAPARIGRFRLTATKEWFAEAVIEGLELAEDETLAVDVELRRSIFTAPDRMLSAAANSGDTTFVAFSISNPGNHPVEWRGETRLREEFNVAPWERRETLPAGELTRDSRLQGVAFDGEFYYVSGSADANTNIIYVFNRQRELVRQFNQPGLTATGMRDLEWDGERLWGGDERVVFGMTPDGEIEVRFNTPINPISAVAWDEERGLIWVAGLTQDMIGYDREGNRRADLRRNGLRLYGISYWRGDPDGFPLYVMNTPDGNHPAVLFKMNPANAETLRVVDIAERAVGSAGGIQFSLDYDAYSVVLLHLANDGANDRIDVWQVDARRDWAWIEPGGGVIEGGEEAEVILTFDARNLSNGVYEGEIFITHNAFPGETTVPYELEVTEGPVRAERRVDLRFGWNLVSVNLTPDEDDIRAIFAPLVEAGTLALVKDGAGRFYSPGRDFNNIPGWNGSEGYRVRMLRPGRVSLTGVTIPSGEPIPLAQGWQLVSYYPRRALDPMRALGGLGEALIIAKDGDGNFYAPAWNFSSMGNLREGQGYALKVSEDAELVWGGGNQAQAGGLEIVRIEAAPCLFERPSATGHDMSLLLLTDPAIVGEAAVQTRDGRLVGAAVMRNGRCGIAVRGDDPATAEVDGAREGEPLEVVIMTASGNNHRIETDVVYVSDGFTVIEAASSEANLPETLELLRIHPNPFNAALTIEFGHPLEGRYSLAVYDLSGRRIKVLEEGAGGPGLGRAMWKAGDAPAGLYLVQLVTPSRRLVRKATLLK